ncbi:gluconate transport-inducing protein [Vairimorpha ceranae]|nr:gluconate transport-inducing protein [Vairimorpha ceranae]KKO76371.1 gluconate transport-inducing protein [Vairimorpha ceranae]
MNKLFGYIQNYEDALLMVHATRLGYITPVTQRLRTDERDSLRSGDIFVFIETENGIKRWTDGKIWSPSKINGQFLLYKEVPRHLSKSAIKKCSLQKNLSKDQIAKLHKEIREDDKLGFHKKTISIVHEGKTYHIIGYYRPIFSKEALINIPFFNQIDFSLRKYPGLLSDKFLSKEISDKNFFNKFDLPNKPNSSIFSEAKRLQLEKIAFCVLHEWVLYRSKESGQRKVNEHK